MRTFKDHFSGHAALYRDARPLPPADWFAWLAGQAPDDALAWDAGCGNGQASLGLAEHFRRVVATDPSATQIAEATPHPAIDYRVEPAERSSLAAGSASLVCVSQALHWFDLGPFTPRCAGSPGRGRCWRCPATAIAAWTVRSMRWSGRSTPGRWAATGHPNARWWTVVIANCRFRSRRSTRRASACMRSGTWRSSWPTCAPGRPRGGI